MKFREVLLTPLPSSSTIYTLCRFLLRSVAPRQLARAEQPEQQQRGFKRSLSVRMKKVFSRPSVKERKGSNNSDEAKERPKEKELEPPPGGLRRSLTNPDTVMERRRRQVPPRPPPDAEDTASTVSSCSASSVLVRVTSELPNRSQVCSPSMQHHFKINDTFC